ncbi:MAG TPA: glycosyltransferase family 4 protein, partial [Gammaproteobacteria bacterium]|nr:glycosyltransferase family 4 protein [Gammaproteobacteria bacterium]
KAQAHQHNIHQRVEWLGEVTEEEKHRQYAHALGVIYPPLNEDYGYVTLEAMLASKPIVTCTDAGGPLEFVRAGETGLIAEPIPKALAAAMDKLWAHRDEAKAMGEVGRASYQSHGISWPNVVRHLLS